MLSKLAVRRLTKLADYMAKLPKAAEKHFSMTDWFRHRGKDEHNFGHEIDKRDLRYCGTVACALGWASTIPSFRKAGLKLQVSGWDPSAAWPKLPDSIRDEFGDRPDGYRVARVFFDLLSERQTKHLFGAYIKGVKTPKQWAARCRKFLRDNA